MAKKKAASNPFKKTAARKAAVKKTAVKKVVVKKSVGKKGSVKKNAKAKQNREMQGPTPVNYALRLAGQFGGFYYYLMLQCPDMNAVLGVVKSSSGNLAKTCAAIAPADQYLVHYEWYKGYRTISETSDE
ncbi:MAG: hypothetical protein ACK56G_11260 [Pirellulaceae bacterium]